MAFDGFTEDERSWLASQRLGRLATVAPDRTLDNAPVTYFVRADDTIDIGGMHMARRRRSANVEAGSRVAFVVDVATPPTAGIRPISRSAARPSGARCRTPADGFSREVIRIRPD